jgi:hypothetical protein
VVLGVDVGRTSDSTVVAIRQGSTLVECREYRRTDSYAVAALVEDTLREFVPGDRFGPTGTFTVVTDAAGIGAGAADMIREELGSNAVDFLAGAGASSQRYANRRAEAFWTLRTLLEHAKIGLPDDPTLIEELRAMTWSLDGAGRIVIGAKSTLRSDLGRSPDRADAVAQAFSVPIGVPFAFA